MLYKELINEDISIEGFVATGFGYVEIEPVSAEAVPAGAARSVADVTAGNQDVPSQLRRRRRPKSKALNQGY